MNRSSRRCRILLFVVLSLAAHAALLFFVKPWSKPVVNTPIEVALIYPEPAPTQAHPSNHATTNRASRIYERTHDSSRLHPHPNTALPRVENSQKGLKLAPSFVPYGDFATSPSGQAAGPALETSAVARAELALDPRATARESVDDPTAPWGSGGADFSRVADLSKFDKFYEFVDGQTQYPGVLAYHGIEGTVNARLIVDADGACDWRRSSITSTQAHLRVYILDVLKKVCSHNLAKYAHKKQSTNFDLSFKFAITEHNDEALIAREKKIVGNVFLFYRNSQQSVAEWHLGPFRGMFPVPYVSLDFSWLQENYERVMYSRDPLHDFKDHVDGDSHG